MKDRQDCIFCKIVKGELPSYKVYEDSQYMVFLDKFPRAPGHCLVIPKKHHRWIWDVPEIGSFMEVAKKIADAQRKAFGTEMIVAHVIGDEVPHAHIWLVPQRHTQNENLQAEEIAKVIREQVG